jgi:hypothetical protein
MKFVKCFYEKEKRWVRKPTLPKREALCKEGQQERSGGGKFWYLGNKNVKLSEFVFLIIKD